MIVSPTFPQGQYVDMCVADKCAQVACCKPVLWLEIRHPDASRVIAVEVEGSSCAPAQRLRESTCLLFEQKMQKRLALRRKLCRLCQRLRLWSRNAGPAA